MRVQVTYSSLQSLPDPISPSQSLGCLSSIKIFEFEDSPGIERHELHYKAVLELDVDYIYSETHASETTIEGSADGLLFLRNVVTRPEDSYVCNPITCEYIKLPKPEGIRKGTVATYGFGVGRLSNQYKVVRFLHDWLHDPITGLILSIAMPVWQVYTLGTSSWRNVTSEMPLGYSYFSDTNGKFLNGNLHWLARDSRGSWQIPCFDLEKEALTEFRGPIVESGGTSSLLDIGVLGDRLCLCDASVNEIVVYLMSDYGDEDKSWTKEYVISKIPDFRYRHYSFVYAVKAFGDGDVLLAFNDDGLFCYSNRAKTMTPVNMFRPDNSGYLEAILYTPSFISLKDFETENAKLFEFQGFEYEWFY